MDNPPKDEAAKAHYHWLIPDSVWKNQAPTDTNYHLRAVEEDRDVDYTNNIIDLVMRMAELALATGASASEATAMALRIMGANKIRAHIDITNSAVTVSRPGGPGKMPITALRTVRSRVTDYSRLGHLEVLADDWSTGKIGPTEARVRFNKIAIEPREYRWWVLLAAQAIKGGGLALVLGGSYYDSLIALITTTLVILALKALGRLVIPSLFVNAIAAAIPTLCAMLLLQWTPFGIIPNPAIVVGASIVSMLSGLSLVSAVKDGLDGYYLTSGARTYQAIVSTCGIVLGVMGVLFIALHLGVTTSLNTAPFIGHPLAIRMLSSGVMAAAFAITSYTAPRAVLVCGAFGALAQVVSYFSNEAYYSPIITAGVTATIVAWVATFGARRWRIPAVAMISAGILTQVPGSLIYRGIYALVRNHNDPTGFNLGPSILIYAVLIGVSLAVGISLGSLLARPFILPADQAGRSALLRTWLRGTPNVMRHNHRQAMAKKAAKARAELAAQDLARMEAAAQERADEDTEQSQIIPAASDPDTPETKD